MSSHSRNINKYIHVHPFAASIQFLPQWVASPILQTANIATRDRTTHRTYPSRLGLPCPLHCSTSTDRQNNETKKIIMEPTTTHTVVCLYPLSYAHRPFQQLRLYFCTRAAFPIKTSLPVPFHLFSSSREAFYHLPGQPTTLFDIIAKHPPTGEEKVIWKREDGSNKS